MHAKILAVVGFAAVANAAGLIPSPNGDPTYNYCKAATPAGTYQPLAAAQLRLVQLVTRHGDRTPTALVPNDSSTWNCSAGINTDITHMQNTWDIAQNAVTSKDRGVKGWGAFTWNGSCMPGQLTPEGAQMHVELGQDLRGIYVDELGFLPASLQNGSEVYLRSTGVWRVQQSARAML
ncbi:histidine phosphatase superfamily, partial [Blyttiomyces helicus]